MKSKKWFEKSLDYWEVHTHMRLIIDHDLHMDFLETESHSKWDAGWPGGDQPDRS